MDDPSIHSLANHTWFCCCTPRADSKNAPYRPALYINNAVGKLWVIAVEENLLAHRYATRLLLPVTEHLAFSIGGGIQPGVRDLALDADGRRRAGVLYLNNSYISPAAALRKLL